MNCFSRRGAVPAGKIIHDCSALFAPLREIESGGHECRRDALVAFRAHSTEQEEKRRGRRFYVADFPEVGHEPYLGDCRMEPAGF